MLIYKKKNFSRYLYLLFVGALAAILVVFTLRALRELLRQRCSVNRESLNRV